MKSILLCEGQSDAICEKGEEESHIKMDLGS